MEIGPGGPFPGRDSRAEAAEQQRISRVVRRETIEVILVVTIGVAFLGAGILSFGDPAGPSEDGTIDVDVEWRTDGGIDTTIRTDVRSLSARRELARALVPTVYPEGAVVDVAVPERPSDPVRATSRGAVAGPGDPLHLELGALVDAAAAADVHIATLDVHHPFVGRELTADPAPDDSGTRWVSWYDITSDEVPELTIVLRPDGALWATALGGLVVAGLVTATAAVAVPRRARARGFVGPALRRRFNVLLTVCGVGITAAIVVTSRVDHVLIAYDIDASLRRALLAAPFIPFLIAGAGLALTANAFTVRRREEARGGWPGPPPPAGTGGSGRPG